MLPSRGDRATATLDLRGLAEPVTFREIGEYHRSAAIPAGRRWWSTAIVIAVYLTGQAIFLRVMMPAFGLDAAVADAVYGGFLVFTGLYALLLGAFMWRNTARPVRIARTARANGLDYRDRGPAVAELPGTMLRESSSLLVTTDVISGSASAATVGARTVFTAATVGPQVGGIRRRHGIAVIPLDRRTPHIVLGNRRAGVLRTSGRRFSTQQRLSLEGDFDRTFTLYCPRGYETDALYIFTPDLMALMLDLASDCEAELIDGSLVLYSAKPWRLWTARGFTRLVELVDLVGRKTRSRTELYTDDHAATPLTVAVAGRRLRARPSWGAIASTIVPAAFILFGLISMVVDAF